MSAAEHYVTSDDGRHLPFHQIGTGGRTILIPNWLYLVDEFERLANGRTLWIEAPEPFFRAIDDFLDGGWAPAAQSLNGSETDAEP